MGSIKLALFFRRLFSGRRAEQRPEGIDLRQKGKGHSEKAGSQRFLAYSPEFKQFAREHRNILAATRNFFMENWLKIEAMPYGQEIADEKTGIRVKKELTGSYKGARKHFTFKVIAGGKEFFVKTRSGISTAEIADRTKKLDSFLRKKNYKINGFNVRIIRPHLVYEGPDRTSWLVTDFYSEERVKMVEDLKGGLRKKIENALSKIQPDPKIPNWAFGYDLIPKNSFYEIKTNTIWLFDI